MDSCTPCLIGIAQRTIREQPGPEPLDLWESVAREAAEDARLPLHRLGSIQIVWTDSWQYDSPVGRLAERLGAHPRHRAYSAVGGTAPQRLIGEAAAGIAAGRFDAALVTGAEALATRRAYRKAGEHAPWSHPADPKPPYGWERPPHPSALAHGLFLPVHTYPIMETARRARLGRTIEEEVSERARIMAPMTEVAAANPYAWRRTARTAGELAADRRYVGWPYTRSAPNVLIAKPVRKGGDEVLKVVFPDGTRAQVRYPAKLGLAKMGSRPLWGAWVDGRFRQFVAPYAGEIEITRGGKPIRHFTPNVTLWPRPAGSGTRGQVLLFAFGPWRLAVYDVGQGLTFEQRMTMARQVKGRVTEDGYLVLSAGEGVRAAPPGTVVQDRPAGPQLWFGGLGKQRVALVPTPHCAGKARMPAIDGPGRRGEMVCRGDVLVAVTGPPEFRRMVLDKLRVTLT
ncbi:hypothetical protein [Nonomuraea sp. NPDC049309]|uniref:hypothetical protein n=1 Tax=Nonomuraea sp. NPDC049309 TaxID=3364350 RepID=UPI003712734B